MDKAISVVVPVHNEGSRVLRALASLEAQTLNPAMFEAIWIDSASTDQSMTSISSRRTRFESRHVTLDLNLGPGIARNAGIAASSGDWIIFLDADDELEPHALEALAGVLQTSPLQPDVIAFNWRRPEDLSDQVLSRRDHRYLRSQCDTLRQFSKHHMDGSVIFSAFRREFLQDHNLDFPPGLHEDISFAFKAYFYSRCTIYQDTSLYVKHSHGESVTHTMSREHLDGYLKAYCGIVDWWDTHSCPGCGSSHGLDARVGLAGAFASRAREVVRRIQDPEEQRRQLVELRRLFEDCGRNRVADARPSPGTAYAQIFSAFVSPEAETSHVAAVAARLEGVSLSCPDLHESLFLGPDEVRTCCKRFFVDGEMRGDAPLDLPLIDGEYVSPSSLWTAKRDLWLDINTGEPSACDSCPYLASDKWAPIDRPLPIRHVSMEQHSVCNLRCSYCDDKYYGGLRPRYDVSGTLESLVDGGLLQECRLVVWGGGEPTLDPQFEHMLKRVRDGAPSAQHRILSNALRYSPAVVETIASKSGQLVTSIDAGDADVFRIVRGRKGFNVALENLERYCDAGSDRVTLKYILTEDNCRDSDVDGFLHEIEARNLGSAYFQISGDFKLQSLTRSMLLAAIRLYLGLLARDVRHVYMDEHVWVRWMHESDEGATGDLLSVLSDQELNLVAKPGAEPMTLWGAGQLASILMARPGFVDRWQISQVVDSFATRVGRSFHGSIVEEPSELLRNDNAVFLCGIQGMVHMYEEFSALGIPQRRLQRLLLW